MLHPDDRITKETQFERDLGITGDDGVLVLTEVEKAFGIKFSGRSFNLRPNEYLFNPNGPRISIPLELDQSGEFR